MIELLVVIAIMAILMAILMPALSYVRKQARSSACQSNTRQLCLAMNLYALDHDDRTMPFSHQPGESGYPGYPHAEGYFMGRFCVDRHKKAINVGFVDSRVQRAYLEELWTLKWHRQFKPNYDVSIR